MSIAEIINDLVNQVAEAEENSERPSEELDMKTALDRANEEILRLTKKLSDMERGSEIEQCHYGEDSEGGEGTNDLKKIQEVSEKRLKYLMWVLESESELADLFKQQVHRGKEDRRKMYEDYEAKTRGLSESNRDLYKAKDDLSLRFKETTDQLIRENKELSLKLKETIDQLLSEKDDLSLRLEETQDELLREKEHLSLRLKATQDQLLRETRDSSLRLRETQKQAFIEKEDLSLKLRETQYKLLRETEDLSLKLEKTQKELLRKTTDLSLRLRNTKDELLREKAERLQDVEALKAKINSLVDEAAKDQVLKQQNLTHLQVEHQKEVKRVGDNLALHHQINKDLLLQCRDTNNGLTIQEEWQQRYDDMDSGHKINLRTTMQAFTKDHLKTQQTLHNKFIGELRKTDRLNEKIQEMEVERTLLEDICLKFKKQLRGFFGPRMQDREVELLKMKRKMLLPKPPPVPYPFSRWSNLEDASSSDNT